jgi:hypothetical protein
MSIGSLIEPMSFHYRRVLSHHPAVESLLKRRVDKN